ncbi:hypothetical protein H0H93_015004 [Arthromyces matolae]|nr:hypothetical protein H0H93_015004 [Arthromyces matolae]
MLRTVWNHRDRPRDESHVQRYSVKEFLRSVGMQPNDEKEDESDENEESGGASGSVPRKRARLENNPMDDTSEGEEHAIVMEDTIPLDYRNISEAVDDGAPYLPFPDDISECSSDDEDHLTGRHINSEEPNEPDVESVALAHAQAVLDALHIVPEQQILENNDTDPMPHAHIDNLRISQEFIKLIQTASLDNDKLDADVIDRLRKPIEGPVNIDSPDDMLSIDLFTATNASAATYNRCREAVLRRFPDCNPLSFHEVKKLVATVTGVVPVMDDMCINSCHAFTGPFEALESCTICNEPRYDPNQYSEHGKKVARQQSCTIPLGPQIQALRRSDKGANDVLYMDKKVKEVQDLLAQLADDAEMVYDDIFCGSDFVEFADRVKITDKDTMVTFSVDGVQLYQNKKSDTWIGIWQIANYSPESRFQQHNVLPAIFIPGPNKPKVIDSFLFRTLYHLSALQRENGGQGLPVWDARTQGILNTRVLFAHGTADAVGMTELDGRVGHHGAQGCRLGCKMKGRHKPGSGHYFAAHLQPNNYTVADCNHPDIDVRNLELSSVDSYLDDLRRLLGSPDQASFERNRKATGLSKPSLFSGLASELSLPVPRCFPLDLMHLLSLNIPELLISLWRGTLKHSNDDQWEWATLTGETWIAHGKLVEASTQNFPSSFHRPPRNPAEKISSGYKATEWFLYVYGLGPAFFRKILPRPYWQNFCKLVAAVRIFVQRRITGKEIAAGHSLIIQFIEEYEHLYYARKVDRLQVCRPSIHTPCHLASETMRVGPGAYYSQFTMERTIGDLGKEIRQPSSPFANLAQRGLLRCQINSLVKLCPDLEHIARKSRRPPTPPPVGHPKLLHRRDKNPRRLQNQAEYDVLMDKFEIDRVRRYGRVHLPNGQIARSTFNDAGHKRNTRIDLDEKLAYAEVRFYFYVSDAGSDFEVDDSIEDQKGVPWALVSVYSERNSHIWTESFGTVWACRNTGSEGLQAIPASKICSLVSMQPLPAFDHEPQDLFFVVEKSSLEETQLEEHND